MWSAPHGAYTMSATIQSVEPEQFVGSSHALETGDEIIILPAEFVDPDSATGVVMSVPAHSPDDYLALQEAKADSDRLARIYAHRTYDEEDWDFIGVVREENLIEVENQPIAGGRRP